MIISSWNVNSVRARIENIKEYLNKVDDNILGLVGVYAIEEEGIKLFENIGSDLFSIQGISLIQLTQFFWDNNLLFENNDT